MISLGSLRVTRLRLLLASAGLAASLALAGCNVEGPYSVAKHMKPLSSKMISLLERKNMSKASPLLVRIFKEEAELEIWKQDASGQYALLKTYPICRWSGQLGPKTHQGDRQAPEGFYAITPGQMNPNSSYYLSFNLGYPNAFDRAHGRTGAHLMVHGDCSSAGCYSMTDEQIAEIFALGREAFFAGQRSFQVQAYPFRMTALNMARHRNSPHMSFWRNLKDGYDIFELTRQPPKVDVCEKRYVFNAQAKPGATTPLAFQAAGQCPPYEVEPQVANALSERKKQEQQAFANFVRRGTPTTPVNTGHDGGMHPTFAALYESREVRDARGQVRGVEVVKRVNPLGPVDYNPAPDPESRTAVASVSPSAISGGTPANVPMPRPVPGRSHALASSGGGATAYAPSAGGSTGGRFFSGLYSASVDRINRAFGFGEKEKPAPVAEKKKTRRAARTRMPKSAPAPKPAPEHTASAAPAPAPTRETASASPAPQRPSSAASLVTGAQPVVPAGSFEQRWQGAAR